jgi:hypothetical protein
MNNVTQRLTLGRSSQLHGEKGLESTIFQNANIKNGNSNIKSFACVSHVGPIL